MWYNASMDITQLGDDLKDISDIDLCARCGRVMGKCDRYDAIRNLEGLGLGLMAFRCPDYISIQDYLMR